MLGCFGKGSTPALYVRTPKRSADISSDWLAYILTQYEARTNPGAAVKVTSYQVKPATKPGENFNSEVVKITVEGCVLRSHHDAPDSSSTKTNPDKYTPTKTNPDKYTPTKTNPDKSTLTNSTPDKFTPTNSTPTNSIPDESTLINSTPTTYHLIAKLLLGNAIEQESQKYTGMPEKERLIFSDIIPDLNDFQATITGDDRYKINIPDFVYTDVHSDTDYILVMQDLSSIGYVTEDKRIGLDLPHLIMATDRLARLHAVSFAFCQKHNFLQKYPAFDVESKLSMSLMVKFLIIYISNFYDAIIQAAEQKKEMYEHISTIMTANKTSLLERCEEVVVSADRSKLCCLAHGDFWTNNVMFLNNEIGEKGPTPKDANDDIGDKGPTPKDANDDIGDKGPTPKDLNEKGSTPQDLNNEMGENRNKPQDFMMIDWGTTMLRGPVLDLQYLIHTSTTLALRRNHLEEVLRHYHTTFTTIATDLGAPPHWDFEHFMEEWRDSRIYGFILGTMVNVITLSKSGQSFKRGSLSSNNTMANIGAWLAKGIIPVVLKFYASPSMLEKSSKAMIKPFQPMLNEFISLENETLSNRVFDLASEAFENGVLDK